MERKRAFVFIALLVTKIKIVSLCFYCRCLHQKEKQQTNKKNNRNKDCVLKDSISRVKAAKTLS